MSSSVERSVALLRDGYVLFSKKHQMYWRPDAMGYCPTLANAGVYAEEEALQLVARTQLNPDASQHSYPIRVRDLNLYGAGVEPLRIDSLIDHLTKAGGIP